MEIFLRERDRTRRLVGEVTGYMIAERRIMGSWELVMTRDGLVRN